MVERQHSVTIAFSALLTPSQRFRCKSGCVSCRAAQRGHQVLQVKFATFKNECIMPQNGIPWPLARDSVGTSSPGTPTIQRFSRS